jgi:regulator of protease activity HflC (stomatin/prohibitin superfamily)
MRTSSRSSRIRWALRMRAASVGHLRSCLLVLLQDITIRKLEEQVETYEMEMEGKIEEALKKATDEVHSAAEARVKVRRPGPCCLRRLTWLRVQLTHVRPCGVVWRGVAQEAMDRERRLEERVREAEAAKEEAQAAAERAQAQVLEAARCETGWGPGKVICHAGPHKRHVAEGSRTDV